MATVPKYRPPRYRVRLVRERRALDYPHIGGPRDAAAFIRRELRDEPREVFVVLDLDTKHRVIGMRRVTEGVLNSSLVHPREVFVGAILHNAAAIIIAHNHPSGDPFPSPEDRELTARLADAADLLGFPLVDHIIVTDTESFSFMESGGLRQ